MLFSSRVHVHLYSFRQAKSDFLFFIGSLFNIAHWVIVVTLQ